MYLRLLSYPLLSLALVACAEKPTSAPSDAMTVPAMPERPPVAAPTFAQLDQPEQHAGRAATHWDPRTPFTVTPAGGALVAGGSVQFWLHVPETARGTTIEATVAGPRGAVRGKLVVNEPGWRRVLLPLRALVATDEAGAAGAGLRVRVLGQTAAEVTFGIVDPRVVTIANGPSLDEDAFIAQIDWQRPELASAGRLLATGDRRGALHALAELVRQRAPQRKRSTPNTDSSNRVAQADRILAGKITSIGISHDFPDGKIAWLTNPTLGTKQASPEWTWSFNRHLSWLAVADAYDATRDRRYADGWARLMRSWVEQVPMPAVQDEKAGSGWRDIETGLRANSNWFPGFYRVLASDALTDDDILLFMKSSWDHASHLASAPYEPTNHFVLGMTGLYTVGSEFPQFRSAQAWRQHAGRNIDRLLAKGLLPEGAWYELAPGYGSWVCNTLIGMLTTAETCGQTAELNPQLPATLRRMAEWGVHLAAPDRGAPMLNDGNPLTFSPRTMTHHAERFPDSALLRWAAAPTGSAVPAPAWTSEALPGSGYTIMRTGWGPKDSYVLLDVGPLGGWHGHQDALNLVAYFHGRYFLFDNGGHKYDASIWRAWGPTTAAHNTVLVDGLGQIRTWNGEDAGDGDAKDAIGRQPATLPAPRFATSPAADYAAGWYRSGYGREIPRRGAGTNADRPLPAAHQREVLVIKPGAQRDVLTVVLDTLTPADAAAHTYDQRWHLKTTSWRVDAAQKVTWTTDAGQPNLAILALAGTETVHADSGVTKPEILGWWFPSQNDDPVPALTVRHQAQAPGPARLLTVLIPFTTDPATHPVLGVEPVGAQAWTVRLRDQAPLTIRLTPTGTAGFSVDGIAQPQP